jgi:hypothetical protein
MKWRKEIKIKFYCCGDPNFCKNSILLNCFDGDRPFEKICKHLRGVVEEIEQ